MYIDTHGSIRLQIDRIFTRRIEHALCSIEQEIINFVFKFGERGPFKNRHAILNLRERPVDPRFSNGHVMRKEVVFK